MTLAGRYEARKEASGRGKSGVEWLGRTRKTDADRDWNDTASLQIGATRGETSHRRARLSLRARGVVAPLMLREVVGYLLKLWPIEARNAQYAADDEPNLSSSIEM
jgi:hypothetical protein